MATYKNSMSKGMKASGMLNENYSAPSNCPRETMSKEYPDVMCIDAYVDGSVAYSDKLQNQRASGGRKQKLDVPY